MGETFQKVNKNVNVADEVLNIDSVIRPYLENSRKQYQSSRVLKEVVIKAKPNVKKPSHTDFGTFAGLSPQADHEINSDQLKGCPILINCLSTMALGLTYADNNFYVTRDYNQGKKTTPVQIYINSAQVDVNNLFSMTGDEVEIGRDFPE